MTTPPDTYHKKYRQDRAHGIRRTTPAAPARKKLKALLTEGWGRSTIAAATGISPVALDDLSRRHRPTIRTHTSHAILTIRRPQLMEAAKPTDYVPATGSRRKIQALLAIGYTHDILSSTGGIESKSILKQHQVNRSTWERVNNIYNQYWDTPGPSTQNRAAAARRGWHPPAAWDDDQIENPHHYPGKTGTQKQEAAA